MKRVGIPKAEILLVVPYPAMKLRADALKVLILRSLLPWTNRLRVARAEPVLEEVGVFFVAQFLQRLHMLLPGRIDRALIIFATHVREDGSPSASLAGPS